MGPSDATDRAANPWAGLSREQLIEEIKRLRGQSDATVEAPDGIQALRTVSVPEPMAEPFERAEGFVSRYFDRLVRDPEQANISIAGERYVLLRAASLSVEFVELVIGLYGDRGEQEARAVADNLLFDFSHALGRADARSFHERSGVTDPIERLSTGPVHFAYAGWASVEIHEDSNPSPDENFFLHYDHPYSFESHAWTEKGKGSDYPVCVLNAGYSSGWCEESFGLSLVATEVSCTAAGDERCRFVMAPPSRIEEHLVRLGYRDASADSGDKQIAVPAFFQRRRWEDELREANAQLEQRVAERTAELSRATDEARVLAKAVENALEGILMMTADAAGRLHIRSVNRGFCRMTGLSSDAAIGAPLSILGRTPADAGRLDELAERVRGDAAVEVEFEARSPDGSELALEMRAMAVGSGPPEARDWIGLVRDVTQRRRRVAELKRQATTDPLTGLPNRAMLLERLNAEIDVAISGGAALGLLIVDLDGFKSINDTLGHQAGDDLLEQVGPRLRQSIRDYDVVARLGGDEFAVLLPGIKHPENAARQGAIMQQSLEEPFELGGQQVVIGASVGVAMCPLHGSDPSTLLRRADVAMYVAKDRRRGPQIYRSEIDDRPPEQLALVGELRTGIEKDQLVVYYQPQFNMVTLRPVRVEALVRWMHPTRGLLSPGEFIPFIELGNLVELLTEKVLARAIADCRRWHRAGIHVDVAVNVPPRLLRHMDFAESVFAALDAERLPADALTLEVTESGLLSDVESALPVFEALRERGVRLSIDDFGTGYSSFTHLRRLPVDEIKIDRTFVSQMVENEEDAAIVRSTIDLGRSIGRTMVAEGVEDQETMQALLDLECDLAQGFLLAQPMTGKRFLRWIDERAAD